MKTAALQNEKIELRTTTMLKGLLEEAAQERGVNVKAFIFAVVIPEAQKILADKNLFILKEDAWNKLNAQLEEPAREISVLRKLFAESDATEGRQPYKARESEGTTTKNNLRKSV